MAACCNKIPMWSVKDSIDLITEPLTHIINLSIESGVVPDQMKIARVIPALSVYWQYAIQYCQYAVLYFNTAYEARNVLTICNF